MSINTVSPHFVRAVCQFCELVGFKDPDFLINGNKMEFGTCTVSLISEYGPEPKQMFVYVDIGPPPSVNREEAYAMFLRMNFQLLAGTQGTMGLHPETNNVFYSFNHLLNEETTGQQLLEKLTGLLNHMGDSLAELNSGNDKLDSAAESRARIARLMEKG